MGDDQIVISSGQVITPETVLSRNFSSAFRGYHPAEVRQFLKRVSDEMAASAAREVELRRALQEALVRAAHPELDEATVTNVLGEHAARLIASARDTAARIVAEAQQQADAILREADSRVARMREEADGLMARRVAEADGVAESIQQAAEAETTALREQAAAEAQALIESAKRQGKEMVAEARALRERMLGDLARRRRSGQGQVEQLRAARERLLAAYDVVRRTVEEATAELDTAEPEARMAAEAVARRWEEEPDNAPRPEPRGELWSPSLPEPAPRSMSLVSSSVAPSSREPPEAPVLATALFRPLEEAAPSPPRPPLRPQTVADAVAGRLAPPPLAPAPPPPPAPVSELATGEVPIVTVEPAVDAELSPDSGAPESSAPESSVDELFARIRADRAPGGLGEAEDAAPEAAEPTAAQVDPIVGERALEGRDDLLENLEAGLTRALKRVLQDEQNEVLDGLRRLGTPSAAVLPEVATQIATYSDAALPWLQQAARAGIGFLSDPGAEHPAPAVDAQAQALAQELVEPLRERLSRALGGGADADDPSVVAESLRATYRQWKVQQVEERARHHTLAAFSAGAFAATPDDVTLQWLVDDDAHCPDCDDNALAGPTAKGEPFPTGQLHPPAHLGCRCLLVPVTA